MQLSVIISLLLINYEYNYELRGSDLVLKISRIGLKIGLIFGWIGGRGLVFQNYFSL